MTESGCFNNRNVREYSYTSRRNFAVLKQEFPLALLPLPCATLCPGYKWLVCPRMTVDAKNNCYSETMSVIHLIESETASSPCPFGSLCTW